MSRIDCPQCGTLDQVSSVPSVYESQTSTYSGQSTGFSSGVGYARGVGPVSTFGRSTVYTSGSTSSRLADQIAPPPVPRLARPGGGCGLAILVAFVLGAAVIVLPALLTSNEPDALRSSLLVFGLLGGPFLIAAVALTLKRAKERRRLRREFQEYSVVQPSLATAWSATYLCRRCHVAFLPEGALGLGGSAMAPVPAFRTLVETVARRLRGEA
ncbi:hypothetical protein [Streptomyces sp. NRRL WC-3742]|uniref:hypothetical protein n=1 Tax=Streptomyces sp. NRRL WC-3742 TaxID=1463934 RepID=UPI00131BD8D9|nr:hypothetical protein [Streptomyces sp. NRRL WC-3742]